MRLLIRQELAQRQGVGFARSSMRAVSSEVLRRLVSQVSGDVRGASHQRHDGPSTRLPTFLRNTNRPRL